MTAAAGSPLADSPADAAEGAEADGASGAEAFATLDAWRSAGAAAADPVGAAVIEALARRAAAQQGLARTLLQRRLAVLLAAHGRHDAVAAPDAKAAALPPARLALSALVDRLGRAPAAAAAPARGALQGAAPAPLKTVAAFQGTWSRLRAEQRLRQALAQVPAQAGPLNTAHLVHRALQAMQALSPAYLDAFMAQVDTLLWLEQASGAGDLAPRAAARAEARTDTRRRPAPRPPRKT